MNCLAIVPARGGSKGIPRKNLVDINGKPMVAYSIEHALAAVTIDRVVVSTDDEEIAEVAVRYGAEVPTLRPSVLAEDHVLDHPVFEHMLNYLSAKEEYRPDIVVHLRPTAPYRKPQWIDDAVSQLVAQPNADSIRSVSEPAQHPYRVFSIEESFLVPIVKDVEEPFLLRRQNLPKMYFYNCVLDVTRPSTILEGGSMTGSKMMPYIMDANEVIDVDTPRDLDFARFLMKEKH